MDVGSLIDARLAEVRAEIRAHLAASDAAQQDPLTIRYTRLIGLEACLLRAQRRITRTPWSTASA